MFKDDNKGWQDSGARWITLADTSNDNNLYLQFRKTFDAPANKPLTIDITARTQYIAWFNGRVIGRGPAVSDAALYYYDRWQLPAASVRATDNVLAVLLFHDGANTRTVQGFQFGPAGLLAHIHSDETNIASDTTWKVRRAPEYSPLASLVSQWGGYKEYYDASKAEAWQGANYCDAGWSAAEDAAPAVAAEYARALVLRETPVLQEKPVEPRRFVSVCHNLGHVDIHGGGVTPAPFRQGAVTVKPGEYGAIPSFTVDYGHLVVGYPEIDLEGPPCIVEVCYGETLDQARLDVLRLGRNGTWRAFQRRAYRFLTLRFIMLEGPVRVKQLAHRMSWYHFRDDGQCVTNDQRLNKIVDISALTTRVNTSQHFEDCPYREQALWILDGRIMALINTYLFGNPELNAKCIRQNFALQRENGHIPSTGPKQNEMFHLDFIFHLVAMLREHFEHTGDQGLVHELVGHLEKTKAFIDSYIDPDDGLIDSERQPTGAPHLDWSNKIEPNGKSTILNAFYSIYLEDYAFLLENVVGDNDQPESLRRTAAAVRATTHEKLFDTTAGIYVDSIRNAKPVAVYTQQANIAAIRAGIPPAHLVDSIFKAVWEDDKYPRPYGPSFYLHTMLALDRIGRHEAMDDAIRSFWGEMLDRDARTWWEVFDPTTPKGVYPHPFLGNCPTYEMDWIPISTCHGWSGIPGWAVPRYYLGIDFSQGWMKKIRISPAKPALLESATYAIAFGGGFLRAEFEKQGDRLVPKVLETPPGYEVEVDA